MMAAVHFTTIPNKPNTAKRHTESHIVFLAKFVPVLKTLCMLTLKFLELVCAFYEQFLCLCSLRIWVNVPVATFFGTMNTTTHLTILA